MASGAGISEDNIQTIQTIASQYNKLRDKAGFQEFMDATQHIAALGSVVFHGQAGSRQPAVYKPRQFFTSLGPHRTMGEPHLLKPTPTGGAQSFVFASEHPAVGAWGVQKNLKQALTTTSPFLPDEVFPHGAFGWEFPGGVLQLRLEKRVYDVLMQPGQDENFRRVIGTMGILPAGNFPESVPGEPGNVASPEEQTPFANMEITERLLREIAKAYEAEGRLIVFATP